MLGTEVLDFEVLGRESVKAIFKLNSLSMYVMIHWASFK